MTFCKRVWPDHFGILMIDIIELKLALTWYLILKDLNYLKHQTIVSL